MLRRFALTVILFSLFIIALCHHVYAAITFDNAESQGNASTDSPTLANYTLGSGSDRIVILSVCTESTSNVDSATFNSQAMTKVTEIDFESNNTIATFYITEDDLPVAGDYTIAVSLESSTGQIILQALSLFGAGSPEGTANEKTETVPDIIAADVETLTDGAWLVSAVCAGDLGTWTAQSDATERVDSQTGSTLSAAMSTEEIASAGFDVTQWQHSDSNVNRMLMITSSIPLAAVAPEEKTLLPAGGASIAGGTSIP